MKIGGLQELTLIDYPDKVAATVFLIGCNFHCPYCHNPDLVSPELVEGQLKIKEKNFFKFLDERKNFLDGICITGGEPTILSDLPKFIENIKKRGYMIKLDTNGSNPEMLDDLIKNDLVDFIAMDIKTSILKYDKVQAKNKISQVQKSIDIIKNSKKDYEFRTTVVPNIVDEKDIKEIAQWLKGAKKIALQQFCPEKVLDPSFKKIKPYPVQTLKKMVKILEKHVENVELRA